MTIKEFTGMLIILALAGCIFIARFIYVNIRFRMRAEIKDELKDEIIAEAAAAEFNAVNADLQRHLKQDGIIPPKPGSEEHYQRWKAERESREG